MEPLLSDVEVSLTMLVMVLHVTEQFFLVYVYYH